MSLPPPPSHLSAEAAAYLANPPEAPDIDYSDRAGIPAVREAIHAEWSAGNDQLTGEWHHRAATIADVPVVWFASTEAALGRATSDRAESDQSEVIVHVHGGSYFCGSPMTNAALIVPIAQRTGLPVVSIDYRLAPEHPFPAAVDDSFAVCQALSATHTIKAMYGESAGGGLALTTAIGMRDAGLALPERLGLIAPWTDLTLSGDTYQTNFGVDPDFTIADEPTAHAGLYAEGSLDDPRVSPLFADHHGLPPTLIQVGGREILLSDSVRCASAMRLASVDVTLDVWDGLWHVWHLGQHLPETTQAFDELAKFLVPGA